MIPIQVLVLLCAMVATILISGYSEPQSPLRRRATIASGTLMMLIAIAIIVDKTSS